MQSRRKEGTWRGGERSWGGWVASLAVEELTARGSLALNPVATP